jgi:hypothetical protein
MRFTGLRALVQAVSFSLFPSEKARSIYGSTMGVLWVCYGSGMDWIWKKYGFDAGEIWV